MHARCSTCGSGEQGRGSEFAALKVVSRKRQQGQVEVPQALPRCPWLQAVVFRTRPAVAAAATESTAAGGCEAGALQGRACLLRGCFQSSSTSAEEKPASRSMRHISPCASGVPAQWVQRDEQQRANSSEQQQCECPGARLAVAAAMDRAQGPWGRGAGTQATRDRQLLHARVAPQRTNERRHPRRPIHPSTAGRTHSGDAQRAQALAAGRAQPRGQAQVHREAVEEGGQGVGVHVGGVAANGWGGASACRALSQGARGGRAWQVPPEVARGCMGPGHVGEQLHGMEAQQAGSTGSRGWAPPRATPPHPTPPHPTPAPRIPAGGLTPSPLPLRPAHLSRADMSPMIHTPPGFTAPRTDFMTACVGIWGRCVHGGWGPRTKLGTLSMRAHSCRAGQQA